MAKQRIIVTDQGGYIEDAGTSREDLIHYLNGTAASDYRAEVLGWYDNGHQGKFEIKNGPVDAVDLDVWEVIDA